MNNKTKHINAIALVVTFFLAITSSSFSQNWKPINKGDIYNFKIDTNTIITNTIWVDSVSTNGNDSIYHLNRIAHECDTCNIPYYSPILNINYPQFLQKKVRFRDNGIFIFSDTSTFVLKSLANINDTWIFDTINNINATISSQYSASYFGITDSFKTILLSTGDTIVLSKSFGIIQFPYHYNSDIYYKLFGIENRNLGIKVPNFWDIFNFNVGDVFQYKGSSGNPGGNDFWTYKFIINSKSTTDSSYIYNISYYTNYFGFWDPSTYHYEHAGDSTIIFTDSLNHSANKFNNEPTKPCWIFNCKYSIYYDFNCFEMWEHENIYFSKTEYISCNTNEIIKSRNENVYITNYDSTLNYNGYQTTLTNYSLGLGAIYSSFMFFENGGSETLEGYIKNGDTKGTVSTDGIILSRNLKEQKNYTVNIFPNPAKDFIEIEFLDNYKIASGTIILTNINGSEIKKQQFDSMKTKVNISELNDGIYIIKIISEQGITLKKLIIQK
ncbi:MAG: hypothetical protein A2033_17650 [Bacteroidetes bacterium GWA2_31_9]|nr:MAG: hypothetical protein A2033_17650 [Bacteroidetes bacterium GWA2_31_9]